MHFQITQPKDTTTTTTTANETKSDETPPASIKPYLKDVKAASDVIETSTDTLCPEEIDVDERTLITKSVAKAKPLPTLALPVSSTDVPDGIAGGGGTAASQENGNCQNGQGPSAGPCVSASNGDKPRHRLASLSSSVTSSKSRTGQSYLPQTDETRAHHVHSGCTTQYLRLPSTLKRL